MRELYKKLLTGGVIAFVVAISFFAGLFVDAQKVKVSIDGAEKGGRLSEAEFREFWKVWDLINEKHVNSGSASSTPDKEKVYGAIQGLVASVGDPYTQFFPPVESKEFEQELSGSLEGVGMTVGARDGVLMVIAPLKNSPAERAGILPEDVIVQVGDKNVIGMSVDDAIRLIRGPKGTSVEISVQRKGKDDLLKFSIVRDVIQIPTIETQKKGDVFVVKIYEFNATASTLFRNAMKEFFYSGSKKLVIDVRNNPGGYLESAVDVASWFVPTGKVIVTEDFGVKKKPVVHRSKGYNVFGSNTKIVILTNGGSASASEILAGALSEYGVATIVGEKTFGKGSVQELVPLADGTSLKITIAKWLTPLGNSISAQGLKPQIEVKMTEEDYKGGKDPQLDKALEILKK